MADVYCVGEALIDFVSKEAGKSLSETKVFEKHVGGAPLNVAVGVSRLGVDTGFVGRVGNDPFGKNIIEFLRSHGVNVEFVVLDKRRKTRLAFIYLSEAGERDFEFWERNPADANFRKEEIPIERLAQARLVHFGSLSLIDRKSREVVFWLKKRLISSGPILTFDVNYRNKLWKNKEMAYATLKDFAMHMDVVKLSEEELLLFCRRGGLIDCIREVQRELDVKILAVTMGENGSIISTNDNIFEIEAFKEKVVDTTGCGDAYMAAVIYYILQKGMPNGFQDGVKMGIFANAAGALCLRKCGATEGLPELDELLEYSKVEL